MFYHSKHSFAAVVIKKQAERSGDTQVWGTLLLRLLFVMVSLPGAIPQEQGLSR
ncbi:hypothetical protein KTAU_02880 [Thermogemmatispora aurantia]|uniref:Uncharacterized protein n=1 Tax=Thermogemmatispora aurantia TaxID=2045279 RepID=A0A5J4K4E8_9CHLR|nr:hypothetical protein KTAU_02880 [Thermogemmatispora aurantia]